MTIEIHYACGDGRYGIDAVGESRYQDNIRAARKTISESLGDLKVLAELIFENYNKHDPNAVAIHVDGRRVAYLRREYARFFRENVLMGSAENIRYVCKAWIKGHSLYGVWLDLGQGGPKFMHYLSMSPDEWPQIRNLWSVALNMEFGDPFIWGTGCVELQWPGGLSRTRIYSSYVHIHTSFVGDDDFLGPPLPDTHTYEKFLNRNMIPMELETVRLRIKKRKSLL